VARVSINGQNGSFWCSCALVNNTGNNYTPYVLTADHCLKAAGLDAVDNNNADQCVFYWEYEHSGCQNSSVEPIWITTTGATVKANNSYTDFALFRLTQDPRNNPLALPYYLGWSRSANVTGDAIGIHHPRGDVKKFSQINQIYNYPYSISWNDGTYSSPYTHWEVSVNNGATERGSSGSPLIDYNRKVIGQLHGGSGTCAPATIYYGKFDISWTSNGATDSRRRLKDWLDPTNTNAQSINGIIYNTDNIFFTGNIQQYGCGCVPNPGNLWFNQYQDGPLYVCPGSFEMYFKSNRSDLTFSYSGPGSYYFNHLGGGNYLISGTFGYAGNMVSFTFTRGSGTSSTNMGLSFYIGCNGAYNTAISVSVIKPDLKIYDPVLLENEDVSNVPSDDALVRGVSGAIVIHAENDMQACIYNISGQVVAKQLVNAGIVRISVPAGLYFVILNNDSYKIIVK
jgi:hypothetical protein